MNRATQRPGAKGGVRALFGDVLLGCFRELDAHALDDEALAQVVDHEVDDLGDVLAREGLEDDRLVDAVQELGAEQLLELGHD